MTSFPASVKSFSTKVDGTSSIEASHVNDSQDEIVAIENGLRSSGVSWTTLPLFNGWSDYNNRLENGSCEKPLVETVNYCKNPSWEYGSVYCTGGTVTSVSGKRIHTFTGDGTLVVVNAGNVDYLVVAGGGGGGQGRAAECEGGGGGAGGLLTGTLALTTGSKTVTVGAGGPNTTVGYDSVLDSITAKGGGKGGDHGGGQTAGAGGSGGGGATIGTGGAGEAGPPRQGYNGGSDASGSGSGGGGGSGGVGANGSASTGGGGGTHTHSSISGSDVAYAGGGGGAGITPGTGGGGGGANGNSGAATANTGGGGGGGRSVGSVAGSAGGSGIVIVSYNDPFVDWNAWGGAGGGSVVIDATQYYTGTQSVKVTAGTSGIGKASIGVSVPNGGTISGRLCARSSASPVSNKVYTCFWDYTNATTRGISYASEAANGAWETLFAVSWTNTTGVAATVGLVLCNDFNDGSTVVWFDACQLELSKVPTDYCDGTLGPWNSWDGTAHNSVSRVSGADWFTDSGAVGTGTMFIQDSSLYADGIKSGKLAGGTGTYIYVASIGTVTVVNGDTCTLTGYVRCNADPTGSKAYIYIQENGGAYATYAIYYLDNSANGSWVPISLSWQNTSGVSKNVRVVVTNTFQVATSHVWVDGLYLTYATLVWTPAQYYKDVHGTVYLRGFIKGGNIISGSIIATLPVGYRPASLGLYLVWPSPSGPARIDIYANGNICAHSGISATYTSLTGVSFSTSS